MSAETEMIECLGGEIYDDWQAIDAISKAYHPMYDPVGMYTYNSVQFLGAVNLTDLVYDNGTTVQHSIRYYAWDSGTYMAAAYIQFARNGSTRTVKITAYQRNGGTTYTTVNVPDGVTWIFYSIRHRRDHGVSNDTVSVYVSITPAIYPGHFGAVSESGEDQDFDSYSFRIIRETAGSGSVTYSPVQRRLKDVTTTVPPIEPFFINDYTTKVDWATFSKAGFRLLATELDDISSGMVSYSSSYDEPTSAVTVDLSDISQTATIPSSNIKAVQIDYGCMPISDHTQMAELRFGPVLTMLNELATGIGNNFRGIANLMNTVQSDFWENNISYITTQVSKGLANYAEANENIIADWLGKRFASYTFMVNLTEAFMKKLSETENPLSYSGSTKLWSLSGFTAPNLLSQLNSPKRILFQRQEMSTFWNGLDAKRGDFD